MNVKPAVAEFEEWLISVQPSFSITSQCSCKSFTHGLHFVTLYIIKSPVYILSFRFFWFSVNAFFYILYHISFE